MLGVEPEPPDGGFEPEPPDGGLDPEPLDGGLEPDPPLGGVEPLPVPPQDLPSHCSSGVDELPVGAGPLPELPPGAGFCTWPSGICWMGLPPPEVGFGGAGTPLVASQPHGSVMVTGTGVLSQTVHSLTVTVKPLGIWLGPGVQVGVGSSQLSVTVYVTGTVPVSHYER